MRLLGASGSVLWVGPEKDPCGVYLLGVQRRRGKWKGTLSLHASLFSRPWAPEHPLALCSQPHFPLSRLAIQMEENGILRDALGSALRGKEEDFRMYHQTLGQVKGVFLQALRQQKASKQ